MSGRERVKDTAFASTDILHISHWTDTLVLAKEEISGLRSHCEELTATKARIQQKYNELSTAVDAKVDHLKVVYVLSDHLLV